MDALVGGDHGPHRGEVRRGLSLVVLHEGLPEALAAGPWFRRSLATAGVGPRLVYQGYQLEEADKCSFVPISSAEQAADRLPAAANLKGDMHKPQSSTADIVLGSVAVRIREAH